MKSFFFKDDPVIHVFVADKAFALQTYLMRPCPKAGIINNARQNKFNSQLSWAHRVVENAFGMLAMKCRVFLRTIDTGAETADWNLKAAWYLHTYIISRKEKTQRGGSHGNRGTRWTNKRIVKHKTNQQKIKYWCVWSTRKMCWVF